jgi:hypothetical protein
MVRKELSQVAGLDGGNHGALLDGVIVLDDYIVEVTSSSRARWKGRDSMVRTVVNGRNGCVSKLFRIHTGLF